MLCIRARRSIVRHACESNSSITARPSKSHFLFRPIRARAQPDSALSIVGYRARIFSDDDCATRSQGLTSFLNWLEHCVISLISSLELWRAHAYRSIWSGARARLCPPSYIIVNLGERRLENEYSSAGVCVCLRSDEHGKWVNTVTGFNKLAVKSRASIESSVYKATAGRFWKLW